jgi:predicted Zn-dependent protease
VDITHLTARPMKKLLLLLFAFALSSCSTSKGRLIWRARDMALTATPAIALQGQDEKILLTLNTQTVQRLLLAHIRITRTANTQAELIFAEGDEPNAFAAFVDGRRVIGVNTAMAKLIGDDLDEFAALLGHETAHWAKGHVDRGATRSNTIQGLSYVVGVGLGLAGVPAAGTLSGVGADLIEATYSREDEREADALSIDYMLVNGFDPQAAVRLHQKLLNLPRGIRVPFLSSHPSGQERIDNLQKLIEAQRPK